MNGILKCASAGLLGLFALASCKKEKEDAGNNLAPETTVSVKQVTLADETTLTSTVHLYWSGTDQDGYVQSYQISLDGQNWSPGLTRTDSLFRFSFAAAADTATIVFRVRSVDEAGLADPTPATLKLPLRNSPPSVAWDLTELPASDTIYSVITLPFRVDDPDGLETLDSVYVRINGAANPWFAMPKNTNIVSLVPEAPGMTGVQAALVYLGGTRVAPRKIQGLKVDGMNTFELQARDIARTVSPTAVITGADGLERSFYLKRKTADLLVLDSYMGAVTPNPDDIYRQTLADNGVAYDRIDLTIGKGRNQPKLYDATMRLLLNLYPRVFWYMDASISASVNRADSTRVLIETVAPLLSDYIAAEGKLLLTSPFPDGSGRLSRDSPVFGLIPADSVSFKTNTFRLGNRAPIIARQPGYQNLQSSSISGADFMFPSASADTVYTAPTLTSTDPGYTYAGPRTVAVRSRNNVTQKVNLIFFSLELHRLAGNPDTFKSLFDKILNQEFNQ